MTRALARACGRCGEPGHTRRSCPHHPGPANPASTAARLARLEEQVGHLHDMIRFLASQLDQARDDRSGTALRLLARRDSGHALYLIGVEDAAEEVKS